MTYFKTQISQFEEDPLNIKDFMTQNITFCLKDTVGIMFSHK